jgi:hypothetical protein
MFNRSSNLPSTFQIKAPRAAAFGFALFFTNPWPRA